MTLLYITNGINGSGGLERVLSIKASYLAEHYNYNVTILSLNDHHIDPFYKFSDKINMLSIPVVGNAIQYIKAYHDGIKAVVNQIQPNIISVCDDGLKGFFIPFILKTKIPIIYERHVSKEIEMHHEFPFWKKAMIKAKWRLMDNLAPKFSKFVVLTNGNLNEWQYLKNKMVIPNPLSFYPEASSTLSHEKMIAVGKQGYQKGYDMLLEAWVLVIQSFPDWHLEIYGTKNPDNKLEQLAKKLNIKDNITFFDPEKNIQEKYLDASIYVMSSRYEGFGMVLIEAMACGVPCVSFDCNYGPSDIIENNVDGFVVPNGNIEALANAICKLMADPQLRIGMGAKAKENVQRYLPDNIVGQWDVLFKELNA